MLKVCLSHDIDRTYKSHQYITKTIKSLAHGDMQGVKNQFNSLMVKKPFWTFHEFMEIEKSRNVRSTVFFLNESIRLNLLKPKTYQLSMGRYDIQSKKIVDMILELERGGWEIGVHGSYRSYNDAALLKEEKRILEAIIGHEVLGIRQHYAQLSKHTWQFQSDAGFKYDSSFGHVRDVGFIDSKVAPFYPFESEFVVFPMTIMDSCFVPLPHKWDIFEDIVRQCEEADGVLVINFHQHVFHEFDFPNYKETYIQMIDRCLARGAEFHTFAELYTNAVSSGRWKQNRY